MFFKMSKKDGPKKEPKRVITRLVKKRMAREIMEDPDLTLEQGLNNLMEIFFLNEPLPDQTKRLFAFGVANAIHNLDPQLQEGGQHHYDEYLKKKEK